VIDLNVDSVDDLMSRLHEFCPEFIGISMMSYGCKRTYEQLHALKSAWPEGKIIAGGPHVTANGERVLMECPAIDVGVVGEGEAALVEIALGSEASAVKGALYRDGERVRPTYRGFKLDRYDRSMHLTSSRGCPYKCIFCGAPRILGRKWRKKSVRGMVEEVEYWYERNYRDFYFDDSNFAVDKTRVSNFCKEIIRRNLDADFKVEGLRADHFDRKLLEQMRQAGFTHLTFGVESGSNEVLDRLKKGETLEQIEATTAAATELEFRVTLFFLIGSPGEDVKDVNKSFQLALKYNVANVYFFNLTPIPGTEFYDWAIRHGYQDESGGRYPEDNFGFSTEAVLPTDAMTKDQVTKCLKEARRIERQVRVRYSLQEHLRNLTGKRYPLSRGFLEASSWFFSFRATGAVYEFLIRVARFFVGGRVES
jgi:anaerobic magnesium-protoporphyrin IX monomethyl ester cyclase